MTAKKKKHTPKKTGLTEQTVEAPIETVAPIDDLALRQEKFCQLFASDAEFFGNGVQSYLEVYDIDRSKPNWYKTACVCASQLLSNPKVVDRIAELLEEQGLNDVFVDKQLRFLITQQTDFKTKLGAIHEYNILKQRLVQKLGFDDSISEVKVTIVKAQK